ncbi:hypothetical protein B0T14DRAFT_494424 [Immersiella caudata]|uniref:N-acetyltransferase domain-containing protein n=1 Tax=Immersiella caudata TaxID=314043 RepID=A0AA40C2D6_9PEZI|nr:hypothetical protein B0T14DRAFT_494424 [Immersiella caudata]
MATTFQHNGNQAANPGIDSQQSTDRFLSAVGMSDFRTKQSWRCPEPPNLATSEVNIKPPPLAKANVAVAVPIQLPKKAPGHFNSQKAATQSSLPRAGTHPVRMPHNQKPRAPQDHAAVQGLDHSMRRQGDRQNKQTKQSLAHKLDTDKKSNRADISSLDAASLESPDLTKYRIPGKKRDDDASSVPSLPSVSSFHSVASRGGDELITRGTNNLPSDVRNTVGLDSSLQVEGGAWETNKYSDEDFSESRFLRPFIVSWRNSIPCNVLAEDVASHSHSDIDTVTGRFIPPLIHSAAFPTIVETRGGLDWRRQTWSSELLARRRVSLKKQKGEQTELHASLITAEERAEVAEAQRKLKDFLVNRPAWCTFAPRSPCHLRPVRPEDLAGVVEIYNWEVENGYQALDSKPLTVSDFATIVSRTQELGMPFVVAVYGRAKKFETSKGNVFYTTVTPHPDATHPPDQRKIGKVLGFAFLSGWEPGLTGSGLGSSRTTAKINIFVHPDYRRKRIGYSLFDKVLSTVSDGYCSTEGYDFVDLSNSAAYKTARENDRKYYRIFTNFLVRHKFHNNGKNARSKALEAAYETELGYIRKMLTEEFNFNEHGCFGMVHRTPNTRPGLVKWLDSVVFDHTCWFNIDDQNDIVYGARY